MTDDFFEENTSIKKTTRLPVRRYILGLILKAKLKHQMYQSRKRQVNVVSHRNVQII